MLLKNANIYDVRAGAFRLGHLFIENGRIIDIGFDGSPQSDAVDMEASYVCRGLLIATCTFVSIPTTQMRRVFGQVLNQAR